MRLEPCRRRLRRFKLGALVVEVVDNVVLVDSGGGGGRTRVYLQIVVSRVYIYMK
jgi:hypothetical protein